MNEIWKKSHSDTDEQEKVGDIWRILPDIINLSSPLFMSFSPNFQLNSSLLEDKMGFRRESVHQFSMPAQSTQSREDQLMAQPTNSYQVTQTRAELAIWSIGSTGMMVVPGARLTNSESKAELWVHLWQDGKLLTRIESVLNKTAIKTAL